MCLSILESAQQYLDEIKIVQFTDFESWEGFTGYAYSLSKERIEKALVLLEDKSLFDLVESEMLSDWQDAGVLRDYKEIAEELKHPIRVAYLIKMIPVRGVEPVSIDTFSKAVSYTEGHHRLLALKWLGYESFPAYLGGYVDRFPRHTEYLKE